MKKILLFTFFLAALIGSWFGYQHYAAPTRIAFVNYMDFMYDEIIQANNNAFIHTEQVVMSDDLFKSIDQYDAIYLFAHGGVRLSDIQKEQVKQAIESGTAVIYSSPTPTPELEGLGETDVQYVNDCLENSTTSNIQRMLNYTRRVFDNKKAFIEDITDPFLYPKSYYYHLGDEEVFAQKEGYIEFLKANGHYQEGGKNIALVASMFGASTEAGLVNQLVNKLQSKGHNVFPIVAYGPDRVSYVKAINPDMVIYNAHGKFGGEPGIAALKEANIPMLCPVVVFKPADEWRTSKQGMDGGLLSQNVTMPELDGGIVPFVIGAQFENERGLYVFRGIEDRMDTFVGLANKFLKLKEMPNADKKIAIFYLKEAGKNSLVAESLEVGPSLWNLLKRLQDEGYHTGELPPTPDALEQLIQKKGPIFGTYAKGSIEDFRLHGDPELIGQPAFQKMLDTELAPELVQQLQEKYGTAPGQFMTFANEAGPQLMIPRILLGNIVLLPVPPSGAGEDEVEMVHGAKSPPPYPYVGSYLWARTQFKADAIMHFGTHGSIEFTPEKQVALSDTDWPDALLAGTPHFYVYVINNIGEATIAKRRSYAVMQSHLTPPLTESGLYGPLVALDDLLEQFWNSENASVRLEYHKTIDGLIREADLHKDLEVELPTEGLVSEDQLLQLHHYLHQLEMGKITQGLHVLGSPYTEQETTDTVHLMAQDALVYNQVKMDQAKGTVSESELADAHYMENHYRHPSTEMIDAILAGTNPATFLSADQHALLQKEPAHSDRGHHGHGHSQAHGHAAPKPQVTQNEPSRAEVDYQRALEGYKEALFSISEYKQGLLDSPQQELDTILNSLSGGYTEPQSGGDPAFNPQAVPSGRNHYSINAQKVPSKQAFTVAKKLVDQLLEAQLAETGKYPERIAISLWSSEFIRQEGVTIAEVLYLLGVEPVTDRRGTVHDVKLIPIEELGRPRIDVVVQTSGQFRDLAASRIYLINRAVELAAAAKDEESAFTNYVKQGVTKAEELMKERGASPADARALATVRVFGGLNGNYGASIMGMVEDGDSWESEDDVAERYLTSMGAMYGKGVWGNYQEGAFEAALSNAEMVIQPRSANTWGALSLDHVYEFMGGISNAIRHVSGEDPTAYFSDMRSPDNPIIQSLEDAIWVEARTTLLNPKFIKGMQAEGATAAGVFAETFRNTFSWDVMKTSAIDPELWDNLTEVYIDDKHGLGIEDYFREKNPYALQEMTAIMLETVRKGYWDPSEQVQQTIAELHANLVIDYQAGCSGFVCDNVKLHQFISSKLDSALASKLNQAVDTALTAEYTEVVEGTELSQTEPEQSPQAPSEPEPQDQRQRFMWLLVIVAIIVGFIGFKRMRKA